LYQLLPLQQRELQGGLKAFDWELSAAKWAHLQNLKFYKLGSQPTFDILIGLDSADLHFSVKDICGVLGQPVACLTPLGWTCICAIDGNRQHLSLLTPFFCRSGKWNKLSILKAEDRSMTEATIAYNNGYYNIAIPWKE